MTECELCYLTRSTIRELQAAYPDLDDRIKKFSRIGRNASAEFGTYAQQKMNAIGMVAKIGSMKKAVRAPARRARDRAKAAFNNREELMRAARIAEADSMERRAHLMINEAHARDLASRAGDRESSPSSPVDLVEITMDPLPARHSGDVSRVMFRPLPAGIGLSPRQWLYMWPYTWV